MKQGGGGGGLSSVATDGVTIQGTGTVASPVAIKAVQVDGVTVMGSGIVGSTAQIKAVQVDGTSITGAGVVGTPLVATQQTPTGWPLTFYIHGFGSAKATFTVVTANKIELLGFTLPCSVQFGSLIFAIATADAVNNSDIGIYSYAGSLLAHTGAQILGNTGNQSVAISGGGTVTIPPGRYFFAATSAASTLAVNDDTAGFVYTFQRATAFGTSTGGALPNSITPPADSPNNANGPLIGFST